MKSLFMIAVLAIIMVGAVPSSRADTIVFVAHLSGPAEVPPNASPGVGTALVTYDSTAHTLRVQAEFSGLLFTTVAAHIHSPTAIPFTGTAGVATQVPSFLGFPLGVTSGSFDNTFDLTLTSSFNPSFVTANGGTAAGAEAALVFGMLNGRAYFNIHTTQFPGGEIRGFLQPVPEPVTILLLGSGLAGLGMKLRRDRKRREN